MTVRGVGSPRGSNSADSHVPQEIQTARDLFVAAMKPQSLNNGADGSPRASTVMSPSSIGAIPADSSSTSSTARANSEPGRFRYNKTHIRVNEKTGEVTRDESMLFRAICKAVNRLYQFCCGERFKAKSNTQNTHSAMLRDVHRNFDDLHLTAEDKQHRALELCHEIYQAGVPKTEDAAETAASSNSSTARVAGSVNENVKKPENYFHTTKGLKDGLRLAFLMERIQPGSAQRILFAIKDKLNANPEVVRDLLSGVDFANLSVDDVQAIVKALGEAGCDNVVQLLAQHNSSGAVRALPAVLQAHASIYVAETSLKETKNEAIRTKLDQLSLLFVVEQYELSLTNGEQFVAEYETFQSRLPAGKNDLAGGDLFGRQGHEGNILAVKNAVYENAFGRWIKGDVGAVARKISLAKSAQSQLVNASRKAAQAAIKLAQLNQIQAQQAKQKAGTDAELQQRANAQYSVAMRELDEAYDQAVLAESAGMSAVEVKQKATQGEDFLLNLLASHPEQRSQEVDPANALFKNGEVAAIRNIALALVRPDLSDEYKNLLRQAIVKFAPLILSDGTGGGRQWKIDFRKDPEWQTSGHPSAACDGCGQNMFGIGAAFDPTTGIDLRKVVVDDAGEKTRPLLGLKEFLTDSATSDSQKQLFHLAYSHLWYQSEAMKMPLAMATADFPEFGERDGAAMRNSPAQRGASIAAAKAELNQQQLAGSESPALTEADIAAVTAIFLNPAYRW